MAIPVSSTGAIGSASLIPGQNTGQTTGTTETMFISRTPTMDIIYITVGIPAIESRSMSTWTDGFPKQLAETVDSLR